MISHEAKRGLSRERLYLGGLVAVSVLLLITGLLYYRESVQRLSAYGYAGAFAISILGGATILVPIPAVVAVFTLGGVLNPFLVGVAAGLGETLGALIIYLTGRGGRVALTGREQIDSSCKRTTVWSRWRDRYQGFSDKLAGWVGRRGGLMVFVLSAVLNPFFYPTAITAGALRFPMWKFFLITWLGKTIKGTTVALAGYGGLLSIFKLLGIKGF